MRNLLFTVALLGISYPTLAAVNPAVFAGESGGNIPQSAAEAYINGTNTGTRLFGGVAVATITVQEIQV